MDKVIEHDNSKSRNELAATSCFLPNCQCNSGLAQFLLPVTKPRPDQMRNLNEYDVDKIRRMLPREVRAAIKTRKCFLAGGCVRSVIAGEKVNDIDLFVASKEDGLIVATQLQAACKGELITTDNAYTVTGMAHTVQIIHRWTFTSPIECMQSFDFTIACAALWYGDCADQVGAFIGMCDDQFYEDLSAKRLVYRNPVRNEDAGGSMLRLLKFYRAGYTGPLQTVADVIARLTSGIDANKLRDRAHVGPVLMGLLREVDPRNLGAPEND